jgi:hypothetical protein
MPDFPEWRTTRIAGVELDVPVELAPTDEQGLDGPAATLESPNLRLILDAGPFADPLTGYASKPGFERRQETIGGEPAEIVTFTDESGTRVLGTRLPGPLTAVVHAAPGVDPEVALRMLRSLRRTDRSS